MTDARPSFADPTPPDAGDGVDHDNPWPGLASFTEAQAAFFHGRGRETEELLRLVRREDLTILFGQSGLGKTSLLQAGLFPPLRDADFLPVLLRVDYADAAPPPAEQLRLALERAVAENAIDAPLPRAGEGLWEYFHRRDVDFWSARNRLVTPLVVFDQFEEVFTLGRTSASARARAEAFLGELAELVENRPPAALKARVERGEADPSRYDFDRSGCKVLLSLREDFLPDLEGLRPLLRGILHNRMRLRPMSGGQARAVIVGPGGHLVEPGVPERIVRFIAAAQDSDDSALSPSPAPPAPPDEGRSEGLSEPSSADDLPTLEVEPALLSIVCRELNNRRRERGLERISADLLAGTRQGILADFYERGLAGLPPSARPFVEDCLLTRTGYRDSVALENALSRDGDAPPALTPDALDLLVARRLLRVEERLGSRRVELTHDVLAGPVKASRDARRQREALAAAEEKGRRAAAEAARRRRVLVFVAAAALLVIGSLLGLTILAVVKGGEARRQRSAADANAAMARANAGVAERSRFDAEAAANAARRRLMESYVREGWAQVSGGDPSVALLWFAKSLEAAQTAEEQDDARVRFATTLAIAPRLLDASVAVGAGGPTVWGGRSLRIDGNRVQILDTVSGKPLTPRPLRHADAVLSAAFSPDGRRVVTTSDDRTARVWDADTGQPVSPPLPHENSVSAAAFSPDGRRVATASYDKTARVWDADSGKPLTPPLRHEHGVLSVAFSADGRRVVTASSDGTARVWDAVLTRPLSPTLRHGDAVNSAAFSRDGRRIVTASDDRTARVWDAASGEPLTPPLRHELGVFSGAFSPDGRRLVTASADGTARVWDIDTAQPIGRPLTHKDSVHCAAFSPDGWRVATGSDDHTARVWDAGTGQPVSPLLRHGGPVRSAAFSPDGRRVATSSYDKTARVWDAATGQPVSPPLRHGGAVFSAAFSRDGRRVVTASDDKTACVWDADSGKPLARPLRHEDEVFSAAFSPDSRWVATASRDNTARVWDANTGQPVSPPLAHEGYVLSAAFSRDGRRIVTASADRTARVWDAASGKPITPPLRHEHGVVSGAFSPDGRRLVTASSDATARVWGLDSDPRPSADLTSLAEVLAAERVDATGGVSPMTSDEWRGQWDRLRRLYPEQFRPPATEPATQPATVPASRPATSPAEAAPTSQPTAD